MVGTVGAAQFEHIAAYASRCSRAQPLEIGLGADREALLAALQEHTTSEARIVWEDRPTTGGGARWTPLLAHWTDRAYLGGLDPQPGIEHAHAAFQDQVLAGRLISDWTDAQLDDFACRYNVGWFVCWSHRAVERLSNWKSAHLLATLADREGERRLFAVRRTASFALKGSQARLLHADCQHIVLGDLAPNVNGEVVLSLHYQSGLRVAPSRVHLERELDPRDPIPFVRLRLPGPVMRVTLTWERP
jgi:hypothetical protein